MAAAGSDCEAPSAVARTLCSSQSVRRRACERTCTSVSSALRVHCVRSPRSSSSITAACVTTAACFCRAKHSASRTGRRKKKKSSRAPHPAVTAVSTTCAVLLLPDDMIFHTEYALHLSILILLLPSLTSAFHVLELDSQSQTLKEGSEGMCCLFACHGMRGKTVNSISQTLPAVRDFGDIRIRFQQRQ